jgi:hypothetical protein
MWDNHPKTSILLYDKRAKRSVLPWVERNTRDRRPDEKKFAIEVYRAGLRIYPGPRI